MEASEASAQNRSASVGSEQSAELKAQVSPRSVEQSETRQSLGALGGVEEAAQDKDAVERVNFAGDLDDWAERSRASSFSASSAGEMSRNHSSANLAEDSSTGHRRILHAPPAPSGGDESQSSEAVAPTSRHDESAAKRLSQTTGQKSVAMVCLIGFHHVHGHRVEWTFPDMKTKDWRHLAMLTLPEGAHNVVDGFGHVYFTIELALEEDHHQKEIYFGVSVYGQIRTSELLVREESETRSYVQKAVVLLAREPCYGWMHAQLRPAAIDLFKQKDFSDRVILHQLLRGLWERQQELLEEVDWNEGLSPAALVRRFGRNTLLLYKLMLLEPRLVLYAETSDKASTLLLSLVSLVPGLLPSFSPFHQLQPLEMAPSPEGGAVEGSLSGYSDSSLSLDTKRPSFAWSEEDACAAHSPDEGPPNPAPAERTAVPMSLLQGPNFLSQPPPAATPPPPMTSRQASSTTSDARSSPAQRSPAPAGEELQQKRQLHGLPLHVFHRKCKLEPYLPMELLMMGAAAKHAGVVAGSSNKYILQAQMMPQLNIAALANAETGEIHIFKESLERTRKLSAKEKKFAEDIASRVAARPRADASPERSRVRREEAADAWVRQRFEEYTVRLLQSAARQNSAGTLPDQDEETQQLHHAEFPRVHGAAWAELWGETHNHGRWLAEHAPGIATHSRASAAGGLSELKSSLQDIRQAVRDTVGASSGIRAAMKSKVAASPWGSSFASALPAARNPATQASSTPPRGSPSPPAPSSNAAPASAAPGADARGCERVLTRGARGQMFSFFNSSFADDERGGSGLSSPAPSEERSQRRQILDEHARSVSRDQSPMLRAASPEIGPAPLPSLASAAKHPQGQFHSPPPRGYQRSVSDILDWGLLRERERETGAAEGGAWRSQGRAGMARALSEEGSDSEISRRRSSLAEPGTPGGPAARRGSSEGTPSGASRRGKRRSIGVLPENVSAIFAGMGLGGAGKYG